MDFHFDDDDFDPKAFLDGEDGADIDLSEFDDVPSGGDKLDETVADGYDDELDLSGLGLDEDSDETVDELDLDDILSPKAVRRNSQEHDDFGTNRFRFLPSLFNTQSQTGRNASVHECLF